MDERRRRLLSAAIIGLFTASLAFGTVAAPDTARAAGEPPVASNGSDSTRANVPLEITLEASDAERDALAFSIVEAPAHGALDDCSNGSCTYTPTTGYSGSDRFTWKANDGTNDSNVATFDITVVPNTPPVASDDEDSTRVNTPLPVSLSAIDDEDDPLTFSIVVPPAHGSLGDCTNGSCTYTPGADYDGTDSFTWQASDGFDDSNVATFSITVTPNTVPEAVDQDASTRVNTALPLSLDGSDLDGDPLTFSIVGPPSHGSLDDCSGGSCTYTPGADDTGTDSFTWQASDGFDDSNIATFSITVTPNTAPQAFNDSTSIRVNVPVSFVLNAIDADEDALAYSIVTPPAHGSLDDCSDASCTYTPATDYTGPDSFTWKANDGLADSNVATFAITVAANGAPVAEDAAVQVVGGSSVDIFLAASDPDFDELTYTVGDPLHGVLTGTAPNVTYTPTAGYVGPDSFTFSVNDGVATSNTATVTITVIRGLTMTDASVVEGDAGTNVLSFVVTLAPPSAGEVTVHAATSDDSAVAPDDYLTREQDLVFPAGVTTRQFSVQIVGDTTAEPDEAFSVILSDPSGADIAVPSATGTIIDDDRPGDIRSIGPLTRIQVSPDLNCAVNHVSDVQPEFFGDTACGTFLVVDGVLYGPSSIPAGGAAAPLTPWTPVSQTPTTGSGTSADPWTIVTVVDAGTTGIRLTQTDTYVEGSESYRTTITIASSAGTGDTTLLSRAADCFLQNSDQGFGVIDLASGAVACRAADDAGAPGPRIIEWFPLSPDSSAYEAGYSEVWARIGSQQPFPDTCRCDQYIDNGAGLSWSVEVPAGGSATRAHLTTFSPIGRRPLTTAKTADAAASAAGATNGYTITVANPNSTSATLASIGDTLPAGFAYVPGSTTGATTSNPTIVGQVLTWAGSFTVPAAGSTGLAFDVIVSGVAGQYFNEATADGGTDAVVGTGPTAAITVTANVPPTVAAGLDAAAFEGGVVVLDGSVTDSDGPALTTSWSATPLSGVDAGAACVFVDATAIDTSVTCTDDGTYELTLTADDGANTPVTDSLILTVGNALPVVTITAPLDGATTGANVSVSASFTDAGANDTHTCQIDWGDSASTSGTISAGVCSGSHTYTTSGPRVITVTVTDDDGGVGSDTVSITVADAPPGLIIESYATERTDGEYGLTESLLSSTRGYVLDPANFGPGGTVDKSYQIGPGINAASAATLAGVDVFFTGWVASDSYTAEEKQALREFVLSGGTLIATTDDSGHSMVDIFELTQGDGSGNPTVNTITEPAHPIASGPFGAVTTFNQYALTGHYPSLGADAHEVGRNDQGTSLAVIERGALGPGSGAVILVADVDVFSNDGTGGAVENATLIKNIFAFVAGESPRPAISIGDVSRAEGNSGTSDFVLTVSLSAAADGVVTVDYATADGTATAPDDYATAGGTLTFEAGVTSQTVTIAVVGDSTAEAGETFLVNLSNASGARLTGPQGVGTIENDDAPNPPPTVGAGADIDAGDLEGASVTLDGTVGNEPASDTLTTTWSATPGADVDTGASCTFGDPNAADTSVTCSDEGTWTLTLTADDGVNPPVGDDLTLTLANADPTVEITAPTAGASVTTGASVSLSAALDDPGANDRAQLDCTIDWGDGSPAEAGTVSAGVCSGSHSYTTAGPYTIGVTTADQDGGTGSDTVAITVADAPLNSAPVLAAIGDQTAKADEILLIELSATDDDGDLLTFIAQGLPSFATLTDHLDGTATLRLAPSAADLGTHLGITLRVSDGTDSDSETIGIFVTEAGCISYPDFDPAAGLNIRAGAAVAGDRLRLTTADPVQRGYAWYAAKVDVAGGFTSDFTIQFTNSDGSAPGGAGADGITFVIQNVSASIDIPGSEGGYLGYSGLANSLVVELDTFDNGSSFGDPNNNHVAVHSRGAAANGPGAVGDSLLVAAPLSPDLQDGTPRNVRVTYAADGTLNVFVGDLGTLAATVDVDLASLLALDGDSHAYVGFTSATGARSEVHDVTTWTMCSGEPPAPNPPPSVVAGVDIAAGDLEGASVTLDGTVTNEPASDTLTTTWSATPGADVDPGATCTFVDPSAVDTSVTCTDDGTYELTLSADDGANPPVTDSLLLTVGNALPIVTIDAPLAGATTGANVSVSATFTDAGANDTHNCLIDWGDVTSTSGTISASVCSGSHTYTASGPYTITVTVTDDDTGIGSDTVSIDVQTTAPDCVPSSPPNTLEIRTAPGNLRLDGLPATGQPTFQSNTCLFGFAERKDVTLDRNLNPAAPRATNMAVSSPPTRLIPAGTVVDSYLIHGDSLGASGSSRATLTGSWTFDEPILGVFMGRDNLVVTDALVGLTGTPGLTYERTLVQRGVEFDSTDIVRVTGPNTIEVTFDFTAMDEIRVLTGVIAPDCVPSSPPNTLEIRTAPGNLRLDGLPATGQPTFQSNTCLFGFAERKDVTLDRNLNPIAPRATNMAVSSPPTRLIPAGTVVDSYLIHGDSLGASGSSRATLTGSWTFDEPILGVFMGRDNLVVTDALVGLTGTPGLTYERTLVQRGVEFDSTDIVRVTGPNTIEVTFDFTAMDEIRVLTGVIAPDCVPSSPPNTLEIRTAPGNLRLDGLPATGQPTFQSNTCLFGFAERKDVTLDRNLNPIAPRATNMAVSSPPTRLIPAGTVVDSYLIHGDSLGASGSSRATLTGSWTFDEPILGVFMGRDNLVVTDALVGLTGTPGLTYERTLVQRGVEFDSTDIVRVTGPNTIEVTFDFTAMDEIRVLTGVIAPDCVPSSPPNTLEIRTAPGNLRLDGLPATGQPTFQSNTCLFGFAERKDVTLDRNLNPIAPRATNMAVSSPPTRLIPAGTVVDSYLIHGDSLGASGTGGATLSGSWTFDEPILGVFMGRDNLVITDALVGLTGTPGLTYERTLVQRGVEFDSTDIVRVTGPNTIEVTFDFTAMDEIRVLTGVIAPDCVPSNPPNTLEIRTAPGNLRLDGLPATGQPTFQSNTCLFGFAEGKDVTLDRNLNPAAPRATNMAVSSPPTRLIPAGTVVDSYLIHGDSLGASGSSRATLTGSWTFDEPILGVFMGRDNLVVTDALVGLTGTPGLTYERTLVQRGVEFDSTDIVRVTGPNTIEVTFDFTAMDEIRVLTGVIAPPTGSITIVKDAAPNEAQDFAFTGLGGFTLDDDADPTRRDRHVASGLASGNYDVTETAVPGWSLTGIQCNDTDGGTTVEGATVHVDLDPGQNITCTFTNSRDATVTIVKDAVPNAAQDFGFTGSFGPFSLDDDADPTLSDRRMFTVSGTGFGAKTISEAAVAGWSLTGLVCSEGTVSGAAASVTVDPGDVINCTFTNTKDATVTIVKDTVPNHAQDFAFTGSFGPFSLDDDADPALSDRRTFTVSGTAFGTKTVTETEVAGWTLTVVCSEGTVAGDTATLTVDPGDVITCTFTNTQDATITIVKDAQPNHAQDFGFTGSFGPFNLDDDTDPTLPDRRTFTVSGTALGTKTVTEAAVAGWSLTGVECIGTVETTDLANRTTSFTVGAGDTITCTFTNAKDATVTIVKDAVPNHAQDFAFTGSFGPFSLDDDADPTLPDRRTFTVSGTGFGAKTVTESVPALWALTGVVCSEGTVAATTASLTVDPGDVITCTFTNTQDATVTIVKDTVPNAAQDFGFTGSFGPFNLDDDTDPTLPDRRTFTVSGTAFGTKTVTETAVIRWDLNAIGCVGDAGAVVDVIGRTVTLQVDPGEMITCTFRNAFIDLVPFKEQRNMRGAPPANLTAPITVQLGDRVSYVIGVRNRGLGAAPRTVVTDVVPARLRVTSLGGCVAAPPTAPGTTITCDLGPIPPGQTRSATIEVQAIFACDVVGTRDNDTINFAQGVTNGPEVICGGGGNDTIFGQGGGDTIYGNQPVPINAAPIVNLMWVDLDGDAIQDTGETAQVTANPAPSTDGADTIEGGTGDDWIDGQERNDRLHGQEGDDAIHGSLGDDTITGGIGADSITGDGGDDQINGGDGADAISGNAGIDTISGDAGIDTITGDDDNDAINGGTGSDVINGGSGADSINGGDQGDSVFGGLGNDTIAGESLASAAPGPDILRGEDGNDTINGAGANDNINGGEGSDTLRGADGNDEIAGIGGPDDIRGGNGNDTITGGEASDDLFGDDGNDTINGGERGDTIRGGNGDDRLLGDGTASFAAGDDIDGDAGDDTIFGNDGADTIRGGDGRDDIDGNADNDVIDGEGDSDRVDGGDGQDQLWGGLQSDVVLGGPGNDRMAGDVGKNPDSSQGSPDHMNGGPGRDLMYGQGGSDCSTLLGEGTNANHLSCGAQNRIPFDPSVYEAQMFGGSEIDRMHGGPGNDRLDGGPAPGGNPLVGGDGANDFCSFGPAPGDPRAPSCEWPSPGTSTINWRTWDWDLF